MGDKGDPDCQRAGQRPQLTRGGVVGQRDHAADHHANEDLDEHPRDMLAGGLQHAGMAPEPARGRILQLLGIGRQIGLGPVRQMAARGIDHIGHLLHQHGQALRPVVEQAQQAQHGEQQQRGDDEPEGDKGGDPAGGMAHARQPQPGGGGLDQFEHQQPRQERRQKAQLKHREQPRGRQDPGRHLASLRLRH
jgi:hypothetical protein